MPFCKLLRASGGSPFEKLATTVALLAAFPQSSATCSSILVGHETGETKLLPILRNNPSSCVGEQEDAGAAPRSESGSASGPAAVTRNSRFTTCNGALSSNAKVIAPR